MSGTTNGLVEREHLGLRWRLHGDSGVGRAVANCTLWQPQATQLLGTMVRPGMHVADVRGGPWFVLLLARLVGAQGLVLAVEPDAQAAEQLWWHLHRNKLAPRVRVVDAAAQSLQGTRLDLVRLDGAPDSVAWLHGAAAVLQRSRPTLALHADHGCGLLLLRLLRQLGYEALDPVRRSPWPIDAPAAAAVDLLAVPVAKLAGADTQVVDDVEQLRTRLGCPQRGRILEDDIDVVETECDHFDRKRRDAEVLTTLAANCRGDALELGTSHGRGTFKLASNLPAGIVHTVNLLPEQAKAAGTLVTHLLPRDAIGAYYKSRGVRNVRQIFANLRTFRPPDGLRGLGLAFVDACHDADAVLADSRLAWSLLRPGGMLVWHDWSPFARHWPWIDSVMAGASRFVADAGAAAPIVHLRGSWTGVLRKPDAAAR